MASIYDKTEEEIYKIKEDFSEAMKLAHAIFGEEAFRKVYTDYKRLPPINKALFDAIAVQFGLLSSEDRAALKSKAKEFKRACMIC